MDDSELLSTLLMVEVGNTTIVTSYGNILQKLEEAIHNKPLILSTFPSLHKETSQVSVANLGTVYLAHRYPENVADLADDEDYSHFMGDGSKDYEGKCGEFVINEFGQMFFTFVELESYDDCSSKFDPVKLYDFLKNSEELRLKINAGERHVV